MFLLLRYSFQPQLLVTGVSAGKLRPCRQLNKNTKQRKLASSQGGLGEDVLLAAWLCFGRAHTPTFTRRGYRHAARTDLSQATIDAAESHDFVVGPYQARPRQRRR